MFPDHDESALPDIAFEVGRLSGYGRVLLIIAAYSQKYAALNYYKMNLNWKHLLLFLGMGCGQKPDTIKIIGNVKNIPASKVYLTDAYQWEKILDSSDYENGKFYFELDTARFKEPFTASIVVPDSNKQRGKNLFFINYITSTTKDTFSNSGLFLNKGENFLEGDYYERLQRITVRPNEEATLYFDPKTMHFGSTIFKERNRQVTFLKKTIRQHPFSNFLLQSLYQNRRGYTSNEINEMVALFDRTVQLSPSGNELKFYAANITPTGQAFPDVALLLPDNNTSKLFVKKGKLTMLIFWASWCGPCRKEIPEIKKIRDLYTQNDVTIKSVSIDVDKEKWLAALREENMEWEQFLLLDSTASKIKAQYRISAVPLVLFLDQNSKELKRITGYNESNVIEYRQFIDTYLSKKIETIN